MTLFQRVDWSAQAHILPVDYAKCFLGWLEATGMTPMCKDLPQKALVPGQACNCSEDWSSPVVEDFAWQNIAYRYLSFTPSAALMSSTPTYIMTLQIFFDCNVSYSYHGNYSLTRHQITRPFRSKRLLKNKLRRCTWQSTTRVLA